MYNIYDYMIYILYMYSAKIFYKTMIMHINEMYHDNDYDDVTAFF